MQTDIDRIITRLAEAVQRLPLDVMISRVWLPGESAIIQNVHELEAGARDAITRLSMLAGAGRDDAAIALRNIGNQAAMELESFILPEVAKRSRLKSSNTPAPFKESAVFSRPVVEINGDLSSVIHVLSSEEQAIKRLSDDEIKNQVENLRIAGRGRFVVNALAALGFPKELLDEHRRRTSEESVHYNHPSPILEEQFAKTKTVKGETDPENRPEAVRIELLKLAHHLLEARLEELAIAKAAELPLKSLDWPVRVSAFGRDAQEKVESLKLGTTLRFRPRGADNKTGRPTAVEPGSVTHFALEYCTALDDVRRMHINSTEHEKADWSKSIQGIEEAIQKGVDGDPAKKLLAQPSKLNRSEPYHGVSLCILWTYKAALLPEYPSADPKSNAEAKADLQLWLDAAVTRARMICWNNWEGFTGWPTCVEKRRFQSNERGRSAQTVVREKLSEGMIKLEPVLSVNR